MSRQANVPDALAKGPFRGSAAVACGQITWNQLAGPIWLRLFHDVYLHAGGVLDHLTWCQAALLAGSPGSALGFRSALGLYCPMLLPGPDAPVDLVLPRSTNRCPHPRLRAHRLRLPPEDATRFCGLPVTTAARTGFDLARTEDDVEAVVCLDALLNRRFTTKAEIAGIITRGTRGARRAARVLSLADPGAESPMETRTRLLLVRAGLPPPVTQYDVIDRNGRFVARLDLAYPEHLVGVEYDGDHHRARQVFRLDAVRGNQLRLAGWRVLRFTAEDVLRQPGRLVAQVSAALR